jgi:hypothetical protein
VNGDFLAKMWVLARFECDPDWPVVIDAMESGHSERHNTKKGAKEAAERRSADGQARHDAHPQDGRGGHFHPNKTEKKGSVHIYYPKKRNH